MSDDSTPTNENVDIDADDLSAFEAEYFQKPTAAPVVEEAKEPVQEEIADQPIGEDDDPPAPEEEAEPEGEEEEDEKPEPKTKKKQTAQERINELTAERRNAERELQALRKEFEALKAGLSQKDDTKPEAPKPSRTLDMLPNDAPQPDAKNEDGTEKYPLGEFDPDYIRDLTRFTIQKENEAFRAEQAREAEAQAQLEAQAALVADWQNKLNEAEAETPDIRESIDGLVEAFDGIEESYGEYLASTLMASEYGPQIMYHLSKNIGEAKKLVAAGPTAATLAIGRLEARFANASPSSPQEEAKGNKKVSQAPEPPPQLNRGSNGQFKVNPDTDDLDAFEREYFKKK